MRKPTILIKNLDWIVTQDSGRRILRNHSLYIEDGLIIDISNRNIAEADYILDGRGMAALPGLVNTHTHAAMTLFRGYADDMPLEKWLEERIWPAERRLTGELCYLGAVLACIEMAKSGTTCFLDMYYYPEKTVEAALKTGLRAVVAVGLIDSLNPETRKSQLKLKIFSRRSAERFLDYVSRLRCSRVKPALGPHAPYTCSDDLLLWVRERSEREKLPVHIHLAETRREQVKFEEAYGRREIEYLDSIGFFTDRVVAAHCVWVSPREIDILASRKVKVAHCPTSNLKLAVGGIAPIPEMISSGVTVALGTDGAASNNSLDMFEALKTAALIHKWYKWDPTVISAQEALDMATVNGYEALGLHNVGRIEEGREADVIVVDLRSPNLQPVHGASGLISNIVYACRGGNVVSTIVEGKPVVWERKTVTVDEEEVYGRIAEALEEFFKEA